MAHCLIALGSNLGDRAAQLRRATAELSRLPQTVLIARSSWRETPPIGGPAGQGRFLNSAALISTSLAPEAAHAELRRIEAMLGRTRSIRWEARALDLDLLLYESRVVQERALVVPHPRMACRRFVLEPAAEVAGWMVHAESRWTVSGLLDHLNSAAEVIAVAAAESKLAAAVVAEIAERLRRTHEADKGSAAFCPDVFHWNVARGAATANRPKLLLVVGSDGANSQQMRKMLTLPPTGPVTWLGDGSSPIDEAMAAVHSVWPALAASPTPEEC